MQSFLSSIRIVFCSSERFSLEISRIQLLNNIVIMLVAGYLVEYQLFVLRKEGIVCPSDENK